MFFFCLVEFVYLSKFSYEDFFQRLCIRAFHKRLVFTFQTAQAHVHTDIPYQQEDSKNQVPVNNVDLLRRISQLEKIVYGKSE